MKGWKCGICLEETGMEEGDDCRMEKEEESEDRYTLEDLGNNWW